MTQESLQVVYSIPLSHHWHITEDSLSVAWSPTTVSNRICTQNQLIDYRAVLELEAPYAFSGQAEILKFKAKLEPELKRAHYVLLSDGQQLVALERAVEIPVQCRMPPSKYLTHEHFKKAKKLHKKSRPLKIAGMTWNYVEQKPVRFDTIFIKFGCGRFNVPFTFEEIASLTPGQVLAAPFPLRPAWDTQYTGLVEHSVAAGNALVDGAAISIPWFPPRDWTHPSFENVRGLASIPLHIYETFREFVLGRRVLSVSADNYYDPRENVARQLTSAGSGHCYDGKVLEVVGRKLIFWEEHPVHGKYYIVDSVIHGVGLRVYAYHEHAFSVAQGGGAKNPNWWRPRCLYRRVHDEGRNWEQHLRRFMDESFAPRRLELEAALQ